MRKTASKNIKGITVEIGGDATKLDEALRDVENKAKSASSELRDIDRAMKNNGESATLWQQKQDVLTKALEESKKKLELLKSTQEQVEKQFNNGEIGAEQYRAFQREVSYAEADVKKFEEKLSDLNKTSNQAADQVEDLGEAAEDAGDKAESSGDGFTVLKGAVATLAAEGIQKAVEGFKELAIEGETALNALQTKTGATAKQMEEYRGIIDSLYANNMGEDRIDLADSIAEVKQQLGDIDASTLEEVTNTALLMRDTFDFDVGESIRAANMLMQQFGVTADEAYTLIAQGAQNGLNKNGDLLDVINEYGVHYKQMGYSAEEFFNSLQNGADSGTFSVDKLGDAMKEFGIRAKDTADSTTEGFTLIGLDADEMREKFAQGGESAKLAAQQTIDALFSLDDKIAQNQAGVDLFGTMWEDMGADAVKSLMDVSGEADKAKSTLQDIADVKYSDLGSQFQQVGRQVKTELLEPIAEKALPKIKDGTDWLIKNLPGITKAGKEMLPVVKAVGTAFLAWKAVSVINSTVSAGKSLFTMLKNIGSGAVSTGNLVQGAVTVTAAAVTLLNDEFDKQYEKIHAAKIGAEEYSKQCEEGSKKIDEMRDQAKQTADAELEHVDATKQLWQELQNLCDESGNVKSGYEDEVEYIRTELSAATGEEIELVDGRIQKYDELKQKIDELIQKKKLNAVQSAIEPIVNEAQANVSQYRSDYIKKNQKYEQLKENQPNWIEADFGEMQKYAEDLEAAKQERDAAYGMYQESYTIIDNNNKVLELAAEGNYEEAARYAANITDTTHQIASDTQRAEEERIQAIKDGEQEVNDVFSAAREVNSESEKENAIKQAESLLEAYIDSGLECGVAFTNGTKQLIKQWTDEGYDTSHLVELAEEAGIDIESAFYNTTLATQTNFDSLNYNGAESSAKAASDNTLVSFQNTDGLIQSYNDALNYNAFEANATSVFDEIRRRASQPIEIVANIVEKVQGKSTSTKTVSNHATGGFIKDGGSSFIAEAGPELIEIMNGGVKVTPITATARNHAVAGASTQRVFYNNITVNVDRIASDYDVSKVGQQLAAEINRAERGKGR